MAIHLPAMDILKDWGDKRQAENLARQFRDRTPTTKELNDLAVKALEKHQPLTLAALLRIGASPDLVYTYEYGYSAYNYPALTKMVRQGDTRMAKVFIDNGADVNKADTHTGHTPLHEAAILGATPFVQMILEKAPDLNAKTSIHSKENIKYLEGVTALQIARNKSFTDVAGLLQAASDALEKAAADKRAAEAVERREKEKAAAAAWQQAQDAIAAADKPAPTPPPFPAPVPLAPEAPKSTTVKVFRKPVSFR